jgi:hypothetical protein
LLILGCVIIAIFIPHLAYLFLMTYPASSNHIARYQPAQGNLAGLDR